MLDLPIVQSWMPLIILYCMIEAFDKAAWKLNQILLKAHVGFAVLETVG